jgi:acetyl esterase/lipase
MEPVARQLAHAGYVSVTIDYRLVEAATGRHRWPTQLDDVQLAVRWVRTNAQALGIDPHHVGAYGWSAGGQLAALLGMRDTRDLTAPLTQVSSRVQAVVVLAGDVDLAAYTHPPELHEVIALLGGTVHEVPDQYRDASPLSWIDAQTAPFLIIHSVHDDVVPIAQSRSLVTALRQAAVPVQFVEVPDGGHDQLTWPRIGPAVLAFFAQHLPQPAS